MNIYNKYSTRVLTDIVKELKLDKINTDEFLMYANNSVVALLPNDFIFVLSLSSNADYATGIKYTVMLRTNQGIKTLEDGFLNWTLLDKVVLDCGENNHCWRKYIFNHNGFNELPIITDIADINIADIIPIVLNDLKYILHSYQKELIRG